MERDRQSAVRLKGVRRYVESAQSKTSRLAHERLARRPSRRRIESHNRASRIIAGSLPMTRADVTSATERIGCAPATSAVWETKRKLIGELCAPTELKVQWLRRISTVLFTACGKRGKIDDALDTVKCYLI